MRLAGVSTAAALALPSVDVRAPETERRLPLISVKNGQFIENGKPVGFAGENWYSLAITSADNQICGPLLDTNQRTQWINNVKSLGMNSIRFWAFPELTNNGNNTSQLDDVLRLAGNAGMRVIVALENHFPNCDGDTQQKTTEWYRSGYKTHYLPYVEHMTTKYKGDGRLLGFQLINEGQCDDAAALRTFFYHSLNRIKRIDTHRLVTPGLLGVNQPGVAGSNFKRIFTPRNQYDHHFDFIDIHDWPGSENGSYHHLPGDRYNGIYNRLEVAKELNMPLLISEIGRARVNGLTDSDVAALDKAEIKQLLTYHHFAGLLGWALLPPGVGSDGTTYDINSHMAQMLKSLAPQIIHPQHRPN